jgi:hypothetical protein
MLLLDADALKGLHLCVFSRKMAVTLFPESVVPRFKNYMTK